MRAASDAELSMLTQIAWTGLPTPDAEYVFAAPRRWRFDFAWPSAGVALEVEGGGFVGGRHTRGAGYEADCVKYSEAAIRGWSVVRVTPAMVSDGRALALVERALAAAGRYRGPLSSAPRRQESTPPEGVGSL